MNYEHPRMSSDGIYTKGMVIGQTNKIDHIMDSLTIIFESDN